MFFFVAFFRFLMELKKSVRNKAHVEGSICEAYIIREVSTFCSFYFEPSVETKLSRVPRNDDGGVMDLNGCLSIFRHPGRSFGPDLPKMQPTDGEMKIAHTYVLLNTIEIAPFSE